MKKEERYTHDFNNMIKIVIFNSFGFFFLEFIIPFYVSQVLGATNIELGIIFSMNLVGHIISSSFTGILTDRLKSKTRLILLGSFGRGIAYFWLYGAFILNSLLGIMLGNFFIGFFVGFFWIPFDTLIAEKSNKNNRANAYGKRNSAIGIGMLIGSLIGFPIFSYLISISSNASLIYIPIVFFGISNFYAGIQFIRKVNESIKFSNFGFEFSNNDNIRRAPNSSRSFLFGLVFISLVLFLANINGSLAKPFLNVYLLENIVNDPTIAVWVYLPPGIISMLLAPKLGNLVDRLKPSIGISVASALGAGITWLLINTNNVFLFSLLLVFDMTIVHTANLVIQNLLSRISLKHRGKIFSLFRVFLNVGNVIGPILGGFVSFYVGLKSPFIISIIVELCLIPFYVITLLVLKPFLKEKYEKIKEFHEELV
ncbi:MAG: MFS transporter [Candidatus Heimdallarchaeota archaeon]